MVGDELLPQVGVRLAGRFAHPAGCPPALNILVDTGGYPVARASHERRGIRPYVTTLGRTAQDVPHYTTVACSAG